MLKQDRESTTSTFRLFVLLGVGWGEVVVVLMAVDKQEDQEIRFFTSRGMVSFLCEAKTLTSHIKFNEKVILENEKHCVRELVIMYLRNKC